jgi:hypothetical protein
MVTPQPVMASSTLTGYTMVTPQPVMMPSTLTGYTMVTPQAMTAPSTLTGYTMVTPQAMMAPSTLTGYTMVTPQPVPTQAPPVQVTAQTSSVSCPKGYVTSSDNTSGCVLDPDNPTGITDYANVQTAKNYTGTGLPKMITDSLNLLGTNNIYIQWYSGVKGPNGGPLWFTPIQINNWATYIVLRDSNTLKTGTTINLSGNYENKFPISMSTVLVTNISNIYLDRIFRIPAQQLANCLMSSCTPVNGGIWDIIDTNKGKPPLKPEDSVGTQYLMKLNIAKFAQYCKLPEPNSLNFPKGYIISYDNTSGFVLDPDNPTGITDYTNTTSAITYSGNNLTETHKKFLYYHIGSKQNIYIQWYSGVKGPNGGPLWFTPIQINNWQDYIVLRNNGTLKTGTNINLSGAFENKFPISMSTVLVTNITNNSLEKYFGIPAQRIANCLMSSCTPVNGGIWEIIDTDKGKPPLKPEDLLGRQYLMKLNFAKFAQYCTI